MNKLIAIFCFAILATAMACTPSTEQAAKPARVIMGYYFAGEDAQIEKLPLDKLTHIIFSFTEVLDGEMKFPTAFSADQLHRLVAQKENHPELKVMVACGGWVGSKGFSEMAATPESRKKFVDSTVDFINTYKIDGIDLDWEYPALPGDNNPYGPEDTPNFTSLVKELREAMDNIDEDLILSFASAGWAKYYDHIETLEVMKYVDYMNIMTYDLTTGANPFTGHHTNLGLITKEDLEGTPMMEAYKADPDFDVENWTPRSTEFIVDYCIELGIEPSKIVLGAAFYGRGWKGVPPENNGLYQPNQGIFINWASYSLMRDKYENKNGYVRYWDPVAKAPYLYSAKDSIFFSYDDSTSLKMKSRYAIDKNLGGIMFWHLGDDTTEENSLLDAIYEEMTR